MKATGNNQINVKTYWDGIYKDPNNNNDYWGWNKNYKNMRFIKALEYIKDKDKFLDIGCGNGSFCKGIKESKPDCEVWGCDIAKESVRRAKLNNPDINFIPEEVGNLNSIPDNYFDVVFAGEILEHMTDPNDLIKDGERKLKKSGMMIITTPLNETINSPEHMWYFTKDDVENLFLSNGFKSVEFIDLPDMERLYIIFAIGKKK